jgi:hypothetical protein
MPTRVLTPTVNALVSPQGWTRNYETVTMNNITRTKRNAEIGTGKILVTPKVTIDELGTHAGTGEEWADEDNAMTSAEAQAFKRACSCFGLGRYFYDFDAPWVTSMTRAGRRSRLEDDAHDEDSGTLIPIEPAAKVLQLSHWGVRI